MLETPWGGSATRASAPARCFAGAAAALLLGSLFSGGYALYVNRLVVGFLSEPLLAALLRAAAPLLAAALLVQGLRGLCSAAPFTAGFLGASLLIVFLLGLGSWPLSVLAYLASLVLLLAPRGSRWPGASAPRAAAGAVLAALLVGASLAAAGLLHYEGLVQASHALHVEALDRPIDVNGLHRLIPLMTAYVYASDRIQSPLHRVYPMDSYVYYNGSHSVYNWVIEPEGLWNQLTKKPLGVVLVYGDAYPPAVRLHLEPLAWGLHVKRLSLAPPCIDTLERRVVLAAGPSLEPVMEDNAEVVYRGHAYIVIPLLEWRQSLLYSIPVPAAYAVVAPNGSIRVLSPAEAARSPVTRLLPLLPEKAARYWAEALRYQRGLIAVLFYHNTFRIPDVGSNPQPYLLIGPHGRQYWVFVAEPAGETHSARYIIYTPADAAQPVLMLYTLPRPVIGVSKIESYVMQAHPNYDWSRLTVEEPMPTILNGSLYWKVDITTKDHRGLVAVDLVDAATGQVTSLRPEPRITSLDALNALQGLGGRRAAAKTPAEKIAEIEKKIAEVARQLAEIQRELRELERQLAANTTRPGSG